MNVTLRLGPVDYEFETIFIIRIGIMDSCLLAELVNALDDAFRYATRVLVEHAIAHLREINCSVLGDENDAIASECEEPLHTEDILSYEDKEAREAREPAWPIWQERYLLI